MLVTIFFKMDIQAEIFSGMFYGGFYFWLSILRLSAAM